jgi:hypothetical protein
VRRFSFTAVALLAVVFAATSFAGHRARPSLALRGTAPVLVVHGAHFRPHERVKITSDRGVSARVRASSAGAFTVTMAMPPASRCSDFGLRAVGSLGSVAVLKRPPLPACMPVRAS